MPRWCYVVESLCPLTGLTHVERFLSPTDAQARANFLRRAGLWRVRVSERRVGTYGARPSTRPGYYGVPQS